MSHKNNLVGQVFNRLTVVGDSGRRESNGNVVWQCLCICGRLSYAQANKLRSGHTKSCGCLAVEMATARLPSAWAARRQSSKKRVDRRTRA